jgi:hypothetical protein
MGYCSLGDIEKILAQTLTSASAATSVTGLPGKLTAIGKKLKLDLITEDDANYYIRLADGHINSSLSQHYVTPIHEKCDAEMELGADMDEYSTSISVSEASILVPGDMLVITDGSITEKEVLSVTGNIVETRDPINNIFVAAETRVLRIKFPDPISFIAARIAAAAIYDKYAKAQVEPGKSEYGTAVRNEALAELNNIREGRTILHGVERRGWRFANPNLVDRYTVKGAIEQDQTRSDERKGLY